MTRLVTRCRRHRARAMRSSYQRKQPRHRGRRGTSEVAWLAVARKQRAAPQASMSGWMSQTLGSQ
jgi:hypothetical protein